MSDKEPAAIAFIRLIKIMDELREQCPWDKKQTIASLRPLTIEEMYELADAIINEDWKGIREELGDIMLHLVFYARIAKEQNQFTLDEALNGICDKLISRHPHIYGDVQVNDAEEVRANWEKLKLKEGKKSVLSGVPIGLPAVVKATRIQEKSKDVGFEWENRHQVWEKVEEEIAELREAEASGDQDAIEEEFGDLMFSLVNYARFLNVDAETALEKTNKKFMNRFNALEKVANEQGRTLSSMTLAEMDEIWNMIKKQKKGL